MIIYKYKYLKLFKNEKTREVILTTSIQLHNLLNDNKVLTQGTPVLFSRLLYEDPIKSQYYCISEYSDKAKYGKTYKALIGCANKRVNASREVWEDLRKTWEKFTESGKGKQLKKKLEDFDEILFGNPPKISFKNDRLIPDSLVLLENVCFNESKVADDFVKKDTEHCEEFYADGHEYEPKDIESELAFGLEKLLFNSTKNYMYYHYVSGVNADKPIGAFVFFFSGIKNRHKLNDLKCKIAETLSLFREKIIELENSLKTTNKKIGYDTFNENLNIVKNKIMDMNISTNDPQMIKAQGIFKSNKIYDLLHSLFVDGDPEARIKSNEFVETIHIAEYRELTTLFENIIDYHKSFFENRRIYD